MYATADFLVKRLNEVAFWPLQSMGTVAFVPVFG